MTSARVLTEGDLRALIKLDLDVIDAVERAFVALATEAVSMPPVLRLDVADHAGEVDVKSAYVPTIPEIAVKVSPGFFRNPSLGIPSLNGLMVVLDAKTGLLSGMLLDNGYLTDIRTAAAGAVAARALSVQGATLAAIVGTGAQARLQALALSLVRPIQEFRVWGRDAEKARTLAAELGKLTGARARSTSTVRQAMEGAEVVVTATPCTSPLIKSEWLSPGQHVTAVGSDSPHKNEIDPVVFDSAIRYVPDRVSQCRALGELRSAIQAGVVPADRTYPELGGVLVAPRLGRRDAAEITLCDLTGTGVQDTAIAALALARARATGAGLMFDTVRATSRIDSSTHDAKFARAQGRPAH